jgi:hypothetical protein
VWADLKYTNMPSCKITLANLELKEEIQNEKIQTHTTGTSMRQKDFHAEMSLRPRENFYKHIQHRLSFIRQMVSYICNT